MLMIEVGVINNFSLSTHFQTLDIVENLDEVGLCAAYYMYSINLAIQWLNMEWAER